MDSEENFFKGNTFKIMVAVEIIFIVILTVMNINSAKEYNDMKEKGRGLQEVGSVTLKDCEVIGKDTLCKIGKQFYCDRGEKYCCNIFKEVC